MFQIVAIAAVDINEVLATIVYAAVGVVIMLLSMLFVNAVFQLNLRKELVEEHNTAFGMLFAGVAVGIAIIVAASIV